MTLLLALYVLSSVCLALYGFNAFLLTLIRWWRRDRQVPPPPPLTSVPMVTVQLPIYNEMYVVRRLIDAVSQLDWPRERMQIQVLDDSDDATTDLAQERAREWRRRGIDVTVVRRDGRGGYKAGALAHGLATAKGEFIAIFDADFVPQADFLKRTLPHFPDNPRLGFVQTRWGHLNADESPLTRAQAMALDGHFVVEQEARQAMGWCMAFNGSAGVWRRECIEDAGGWQADTLAEDLDLSYRVQLRGWRGRFLPDVESPAEVPPQLAAFKRQQARWAEGSIQTLRKIARPLWRSSLPLATKMAATLHIAGYLAHPFSLILLLVTLPLLWSGVSVRLPLAYLGLASLGPPLLYATGQRVLYGRGRWWRRYAYFPLLTFLGTGIAFSNSLAVLRGALRFGGAFRRTPKFRREGQQSPWSHQRYTLAVDGAVIGEIILGLYALATVVVALWRGYVWAIPFLLLYVGAYGTVAGIALWQAWPVRLRRRKKEGPEEVVSLRLPPSKEPQRGPISSG